jgi:hypothetical protein
MQILDAGFLGSFNGIFPGITSWNGAVLDFT